MNEESRLGGVAAARPGGGACGRRRIAGLTVCDNQSVMRTLAVLALVLWLVAAAVAAQPPMTKLQIEVRNLSDKPIERASVVVRFVSGHSTMKLGKKIITTWEVRTNQDGVAKVPELPQGQIRVQVIATGYQTFGQIFDVTETEKTIQVKLNPPQAQYSPQE